VAREAAWAPASVWVAHEMAARMFGHEPYVDSVMHFLGGGAMAFFVHRVCRLGGILLGAPSRLVIDLLAFGLTSSVAVMWEMGELLSDRFLGTHAQLGGVNTMRDLFLGMLGAAVCLGAMRLFDLRPESFGYKGTG
jgi:hypothetical protein